MKLHFDFGNNQSVEFGVGIDDGTGERFVLVTVDPDVQNALNAMAISTWAAMQAISSSPDLYDPSEKHAAVEYLYLPLANPMAQSMRTLHDAVNMSMDASALKHPGPIFCYFAKFTDDKGQLLTALHRASQFKASLSSRFIRLHTNALKLVQDPLFKLDFEFDLLVDSKHLHVLHPNGFEYAGRLQKAIMSAVPANIAVISQAVPFVDFSSIAAYSTKHKIVLQCKALTDRGRVSCCISVKFPSELSIGA